MPRQRRKVGPTHPDELDRRHSSLRADARLATLAVALLAALPSAQAQVPPAGAEPPKGISERALRDAESPFRWIRIHSESERKAEARKAAAAQAAAPAPAQAPRTQAKPAVPARIAAAPAPIASAATEDTSEAALVTIDRVEPEWDDELLRTLRKGRVVVRFHVSEDGYLSRMQIVDSTHSRLTGPAMAAVMQWRFEPIPETRVATAEFGFDIDSPQRTR